MKTRPILFSGAMVRALLDGSKTQTRRVLKSNCQEIGERDDGTLWPWSEHPDSAADYWHPCPHGQPGDHLWVRESFWGCDLPGYGDQPCIVYEDEWVDNDYRPAEARPWGRKFGHVPSIHMPREASRITLEIVSVRVERLHAISEADARAEGARWFDDIPMGTPSANPCRWSMESPKNTDQCLSTARFAFANLFCKVNSKRQHDTTPWDANPWVWVIEFKRVPK